MMQTLRTFVALLVVLASKVCVASSPNIVVILADDLGIGDLGCYNSQSKIPTPHADRLAREGMRFTNAHSPSSVCTPTRYALLTGRYAWRTRLKSWVLNGRGRALIEPGRPTIASVLGAEGYDTGCIGKWHLGLGQFDPEQPNLKTDYTIPLDAGPHTVGFETSYIIPASLDMEPYIYVSGDRPVVDPTEHTPMSTRRWSGGGGFWRAGPIAPGFTHEGVLPVLARESVEYIREKRDAPFFLYLPLTAPHTPWVPTPSFRGSSEAGWYGDFVVQVDDVVGQVLAAIDELGATENTIVIFTSDNGSHWREADEETFGHLANLNYRGMKADVWEGGHRVPFVVRWPARIRPKTVSHALIGLNDLYATVGAVVGATHAGGEDSVSFAEILAGVANVSRTELVHHSADGMFALRAGPWKLIDGVGSGGFTQPRREKPEQGAATRQLYDLHADPAETNNLIAERPVVARRLLDRLDEIRTSEEPSSLDQ